MLIFLFAVRYLWVHQLVMAYSISAGSEEPSWLVSRAIRWFLLCLRSSSHDGEVVVVGACEELAIYYCGVDSLQGTPTFGDVNDVWFELRKRFEKFLA